MGCFKNTFINVKEEITGRSQGLDEYVEDRFVELNIKWQEFIGKNFGNNFEKYIKNLNFKKNCKEAGRSNGTTVH